MTGGVPPKLVLSMPPRRHPSEMFLSVSAVLSTFSRCRATFIAAFFPKSFLKLFPSDISLSFALMLDKRLVIHLKRFCE